MCHKEGSTPEANGESLHPWPVVSHLQSKHLLHQISGSLFTLEEAKGYGLRDDGGWRGKDCASSPPPHLEPCEGSGSKPGVLLQAQAGAQLAGLTVEPSSCSLLCSGCRGLCTLGMCCLSSCTEGCFQLLVCLPPPIPGCPPGPGGCSGLPLWPAAGPQAFVPGPPSPAEALRLGPGSWN